MGEQERMWESCDGMMVIDEQRRVLAMNPALERLTGRHSEAVVGQRTCGALFECRDVRGCALALHPEACPGIRAMQRGEPIQGAEYSIRDWPGRRPTIVSASYTPLQTEPGGSVRTLVVMRDVTREKQRQRQLVRLSITDPLTGLPNRTVFFNACRRELKRATRYGRPVAVAMADLDRFKAYNDAYGHLAGDALLKRVAQVLQGGHRGIELVARYGGDEFAFVLSETDLAAALVVAERLRHAVATVPAVTISIGVAVFPSDGRSPEALVAQADRRLYEGKQRGGNRVTGPLQRQERRRQRRVILETPVFMRAATEDPYALHEGIVKTLSLWGAYCLVPRWRALEPGDSLVLSLTVPPAAYGQFPFSRVAGLGRVVRVEELADSADAAPARIGVAVALDENLTMHAAPPSRL